MSELRVNAKLDSWGHCSAICSADCCHIKIIVLHLQVHELIPDHNSDKNTMFDVKYFLPKETIEPMSVWSTAWCNVSKCPIFYL